MNSEDIERAVRRRVRRFDGVFAADRLPNDPCLLVCNTDPSHNPGKHWVAIYVEEEGRYGEYFDSFGRPPPVTFRRYLDRHCMHWSYWTYSDKVSPVVSVDIMVLIYKPAATLNCFKCTLI